MKTKQLDLAERMEIGNFRKTSRLISVAKSRLNNRYQEFLQEVNPAGAGHRNRFYVPQRHF